MATRKKVKLITRYNENLALEDSYSRWQQRIVVKNKPPTEEGQELIDMAINCKSAEFATFLKNKLGIENTTDDFDYPIPEGELTDQQFKFAPYEIANDRYKLWKEIPTKKARTSLFWAIAHIAMLENSIIKPTNLLELKKECDHTHASCTHHREILRRMGGLHHVRGYLTTLVNCPTAAAWWKVKLIYQAKEYYPEIKEKDAYDAMTNIVWEEFIAFSIKRLTILLAPSMQASLIQYISRNKGKIKDRDTMAVLARETARLGVEYSFSSMGPEACYELVEKAGQKISAE